MKFSIITASFNAGNKLIKTIESILEQSFEDYEIVIKDGESQDSSLEKLVQCPGVKEALNQGRIKLLIQKDQSVYDGMNQAIEQCRGEYLLFLNCGDKFHDRKVLECVSEYIHGKTDPQGVPIVFYGNTFYSKTGAMVHAAPTITGFTCYRNIPCHQSCFYDRRLFLEKQYDTTLKIRADYDHFLWCYYVKKARFEFMELIVADYEGGGISEVKENQKQDFEEHRLVTRRYMTRGARLRYKILLAMTLAPIRRRMAESAVFSGIYHHIKATLYR